MKVSLSWLRDYVPIEMDVQQLADRLTMAGLEVDAVNDRYGDLDTVVIGRIAEVAPHPNADRLKVCTVDIGGRTLPVVCGAPNAVQGALAPLALPGTRLADGSVLKNGVIRGQISQGMLCSEIELGLGLDADGIMILAANLPVGQKLAPALGLADAVIELDLTPNRPDCLSIIGIAREIAAMQQTKITPPAVRLAAQGARKAAPTSVTIEAPQHCPRYSARLLDDIRVGPSPFWLQDRLLSVGLRPINNIVDITNFVMMETGQPLHAFDFDRLVQNRIVVRTAAEGERFTTLDQKEHRLKGDMLMICDGEKPVALAGIMGGLNSEIEAATGRVLIESAYFWPVSVRKTAKTLGISTDASHRFERGIDPEGTVPALERAAQLMVDICGGSLVGNLIDEYPGQRPPSSITLSAKAANRVLGTRLSSDRMAGLLASIEFDVQRKNEDAILVIPPSFRVDVERPEDLMEEVARLSGYDHIPTTFPLIPAEAHPMPAGLALRNRIKDQMVAFGFSEAINYSFISPQSFDSLNLKADDRRRRAVNILNPLTEDQAVLRTSLIPSLLGVMQRNMSRQAKSLKTFEIGKVFIDSGPALLPQEIEMAAGLWTGLRSDPTWHCPETPCDYYDIKGVVEELLQSLHIEDAAFTRIPTEACDYIRPGHAARILIDGAAVGLAGEVHPRVLQNFDLKQPAFVFELNLDDLAKRVPDVVISRPLPKFPAVARDVTLIIDQALQCGNILHAVGKMNLELVEDVFLFDVFEEEPIPAGKRSISFRITYRSATETLEDEAINQLHQDISTRLLKAFDATLPG